MTTKTTGLPFQPIRNELYSARELLAGFDPNRPASWTETPDFKSYVYFVTQGRATASDPYASMMEALHDNSIFRCMFRLLEERKKHPIAAIMGGHKEPRGSKAYLAIVEIAKRLAEKDFLLASGGASGAMEATHLGALLKGQDQAAVKEALRILGREAALPDVLNIVDDNGKPNDELVGKIHRWAAPAIEVRNNFPSGGESLAVPTWHYGHEPVTPLASHIAKYFLNSIREDVLLLLATNGIIFAPGRAGTLQEVFQDAAQNYYRGKGPFNPMVFYDKTFWRETLPLEPLLEALFVKNGHGDEYKAKVRFLDDVDEIVDFLASQKNPREKMSQRLAALGMAPMMASV